MSTITTHILDTARGTPAEGVEIFLFRQCDQDWQTIGSGKTDSDGRVKDLCKDLPNLSAGTYKIHFDTQQYFSATGDTLFYPYAEVVFIIDKSDQHYHIPLLLSPFSYSTYRGS